MKFLPHWFVILTLFFLACQPEEEMITDSPSARLQVSADTVLFDTLLTEKLSLTKRFRIFNPTANAIRIDRIGLGLGSQSHYRIFANGKEGPYITNEILNGGDSILVLVDALIDPSDEDLPYLVKDSVIIDWNTNSTHVKLVSWGQDAIYLTVNNVCNTTFDSPRPYVIYDSLLVEPACSLRIKRGVRMLFNNNAALHVAGTLLVEGDSGNFVTFRNTRFDENYLEAPGQWGAPGVGAGIVFYPQSRNNRISHAIIENAISGIYMGIPDEDETYDLEISNTIIRHMARFGILSFTSDIYAENSLIYNCGSSLIANLAGGNYSYLHCTFSNFPNFFLSDDPALIFSDNVDNANDPIVAPLTVAMTNSIIWGAGKEELIVNGGGGSPISLQLISNIIRSEENIPGNFTSVENNFPGFKNPMMFDYRLDSTSFSIDKGNTTGLQSDLEGRARDELPDLGAFEFSKE